MLYHAIMIFNLNEVAPILENQVVFIIIVMVVSALANSFIFGELASLMSELTSRESELLETIDTVHTIMTDLKISKRVKKQARVYLLQSNKYMVAQNDFIELNNKITVTMQREIQHFLFFRVLVRHNKDLRNMLSIPTVKDIILKEMNEDFGVKINTMCREIICQSGLRAHEIYFLNDFAGKLQMQFEHPETRIILHGTPMSAHLCDNFLYFIEEGKCVLENLKKKDA